MADDWFYAEKVKDHFFNPRNVFKCDEDIANFKTDGVGEVGSPVCGDVMKMWIKIEDGKVTDCRWKTFGCASAIASTSMLSEMVIGLSLEEAEKITPKQILDKLGGLPPKKIHCSVLGDKALRAAIKDYREKQSN